MIIMALDRPRLRASTRDDAVANQSRDNHRRGVPRPVGHARLHAGVPPHRWNGCVLLAAQRSAQSRRSVLVPADPRPLADRARTDRHAVRLRLRVWQRPSGPAHHAVGTRRVDDRPCARVSPPTTLAALSIGVLCLHNLLDQYVRARLPAAWLWNVVHQPGCSPSAASPSSSDIPCCPSSPSWQPATALPHSSLSAMTWDEHESAGLAGR